MVEHLIKEIETGKTFQKLGDTETYVTNELDVSKLNDRCTRHRVVLGKRQRDTKLKQPEKMAMNSFLG